MKRIRLIHWNTAEAEERAAQLQAAGYEVNNKVLDGAGLRGLRDDPPDAVVIDLSRRPSQGRDVGLTLRKYVATRRVPLVFVAGKSDKVAHVREFLPDAVYTTWAEIDGALEQAITCPPANPVVPGSVFDVYAGTPLPKKLGIKARSTVVLIDAPEETEDTLGKLPEGAVVLRQVRIDPEPPNLILWFVRSREALECRINEIGASIGRDGLWIIWPKKTSGVTSDLSQAVVRQVGLASGLVDYKICAVDATWSGLRFTRRKDK
jgi:hypothetical protein